jgi:CHASE2 domain-containing sensor protein
VLGVGADGEECLGGGLEQEVIEDGLVLIGDVANLCGHGEHDVEVGHR